MSAGSRCCALPALQADGELVDGVKPAWVEVERIIAERTVGALGGCDSGSRAQRAQQDEAVDADGGRGGSAGSGGASRSQAAGGGAAGAHPARAPMGPRRQFLCKWRELSYADCTWEEEADVAGHRDLIEQFRCGAAALASLALARARVRVARAVPPVRLGTQPVVHAWLRHWFAGGLAGSEAA